MTRRFNYLIETGPTGTVREADFATCGHCQYQMQVQPPKDARIVVRVDPPCSGCGKYICHVCKAQGGPCKTWERKMEEAEKRARLRAAVEG